jgi:single-strand DNA-binding protein
MNSITLAGNIGRDAEVRHTTNGDPVASFSIADSQGKDKPTIWWRCQLWGKRAESLAPYLLKGQPVAVSGSVTERHWKDKDGTERVTMEVRVNDLALQGGAREAKQEQSAKPAKGGGAGFDDFEDPPF